MTILTRIKYLARTHYMYSMKQKYEEILKEAYLNNQVDEEAEISLRRGNALGA